MTAAARPAWHDLLDRQAGVLGREQALRLGMHARSWEHLVAGAGWQLLLPGVAVLGRSAPTEEQQAWAAVLYAGRGAALGGRAALSAHGLGTDVRVWDVAVPEGRAVVPQPSPATLRARLASRELEQGRRAGPVDELAARRSRRLLDRRRYEHAPRVQPHAVRGLEALVRPGSRVPLVAVEHAAVQGAVWAPSDAAAETLLAMTVQQQLVGPAELRQALERVPGVRRARLLREVVDDLELGVQAAGELRFLRLVREERLPLPDRLQRLVRTGTGRRYLDAWWAARRVGVELDGVHHRDVETWEADLLRSNDVALAHRDARLLQLRWTTSQLRHQRPAVVRQLRAGLLG